jgi:tetratricopeptide (TPR) repeat protein
MRRIFALCLVALIFPAAHAFAVGEARLTGKILDAATKQPIPDAVVVLDATEAKKVHLEAKSKKDGSYAIFVLDGTIRYKVKYSAPGYAPYEEVMKLKLGDPNLRDIELNKGDAAPAAGTAPAPRATADPSVVAYNEGAELANAGNTAEAIAKFEAAVAAKASFTPAWIALAKTQLKVKNYPKSIEAAKKALDIDDEDIDMWAVLYNAYLGSGDKAAAAEAQKHLPANAGQLFNDAAKLINAGKDGEAEKLLKQAVAADPKMARAYYELGMIYVRSGNSADAKTNLEKYIELDPNGSDVATAKEMMKYLK